MSLLSQSDESRALRWLTLALSGLALYTFLPFWAPLTLAAWLAILSRPIFLKTTTTLGGRERAAGAFLVALGMGFLVPVALAVVSLVRGAIDLGKYLLKSQDIKDALVGLASGGGTSDGGTPSLPTSPEQIIALVREHGAYALQLLGDIAGAAASVVIGFLIFFYAAYVFLTDGPDLYQWLEQRVPFEERVTRRLAGAFEETGRGLLLGVGLTAMVQSVICTATYFAIGVPRALVLGFLSFIAALLPAGATVIWLPVSIGLFLSGRHKEAIILAAIGTVIVGSIDNVLRPVLARKGHLQLSTFVLFVAMLGGFGVFGGWGLVLGPLAVRMCKEALDLMREARLARASLAPPPPPAA